MSRPVFTLTVLATVGCAVTACALMPPVGGRVNLAAYGTRAVQVNEFTKLVRRSSRLMPIIDAVETHGSLACHEENTEEALVVIHLGNGVRNGPEVSVIRLSQ